MFKYVESWQGRRQDEVRSKDCSAARKVTVMDVPISDVGDSRSAAAWLWGIWSSDVDGLLGLSDSLLALACLSLAAVLLRSSIRRRRRQRQVRSALSGRLLGAILIFCGCLQLAGAVGAASVNRWGALSVLAAFACWGAALAIQPVVIQPPASGDAEDIEREIAERQRAEAALRTKEAEARKLAEADARKDEFLAMLGHELRNPLAPMRNAVKIMKLRGSNDPDVVWARDVVDHQLSHMGQLVDDLLEISRVTSGKVRLQREAVDVATIVAFAVETSRPGIEAQHHRLSISLPPNPVMVEADSFRMAQVLSNLLSNAAKYTPRGGLIRLSVAEEGAEAVFRVRDNGSGIPPEMLARIFDLFTQVDHSLDRAQGGLGLGLTLVKSLVEMHGGRVEARSEGLSQGGSEFVVRLPILTKERALALQAPKPVEPSPPPAVASTAPARRVLVVDDNVASAQSLAKVLKLEGHDVRVAYDGGHALEAVGSFRPQVVLMDIGLPGVDGYEAARRLRADPDLGPGIALLVAVTGYAEDEARRRAREAGFDHHLVKPVDPDILIALISSLEWEDAADRAEDPDVSSDEPAELFPASPAYGRDLL
jgi:signal transduction histidine kinase/CheY-like chemotaxis protein